MNGANDTILSTTRPNLINIPSFTLPSLPTALAFFLPTVDIITIHIRITTTAMKTLSLALGSDMFNNAALAIGSSTLFILFILILQRMINPVTNAMEQEQGEGDNEEPVIEPISLDEELETVKEMAVKEPITHPLHTPSHNAPSLPPDLDGRQQQQKQKQQINTSPSAHDTASHSSSLEVDTVSSERRSDTNSNTTSSVMTPFSFSNRLFPNTPPPSDTDITMFHSIFFPTT